MVDYLQLDWQGGNIAATPFGFYSVTRHDYIVDEDTDYPSKHTTHTPAFNGMEWGYSYGSRALAKDACQDHFEKKVRQCCGLEEWTWT